MKKLKLTLVCGIFILGLTACGDKKNETKDTTEEVTTEAAVEITDSLEILTTVWGTYGEDEKFAIAGGDYNNSVMDSAGAFDVSDVEALDSMLGVPAEGAAYIDGAASMLHMMNANSFTAGAYHISDAANKDDFTAKLKDSIMNRQWMCGFPDKLIIITIGDEYVVSAFGLNEFIDNFEAKLTAEYPMAEVIYEENLAE